MFLVSEELNNFFQNAPKTIIGNLYVIDFNSSITNSIEKVIKANRNHPSPSILSMKQKSKIYRPLFIQ